MAEAAIDTDQIAQVELVDQPPAEIAHLLFADEDLDVIGPVAKIKEDDLPLPAPEHDPPGDADGRAGLLTLVRTANRQRAHRGNRLVSVESLSPRVHAQGGDPL